MTGAELFKQGFLPSDCDTVEQVSQWGQAAKSAYGRQPWILEACENGKERLSTAGDLYASYVAGGDDPKAAWAAAATFAMMGEEETDDAARWLSCQDVDTAQSEQTDWRG